MNDRELQQATGQTKPQSKRAKEILPRVAPINRPSNDKSLERRSNSIRKEMLPAGVRSETVQVEQVRRHITVNVSESPKYLNGKSSSYLNGKEGERNSSFSKSTVKFAGEHLPSKDYIEKLDQVVEELATLELENRRISAENAVLREELGLVRNSRSRTVADSEDYLRRVREVEETSHNMKEMLAEKDDEIRALYNKIASMETMEQSYNLYRTFITSIIRMFGSDDITLEELRQKLENMTRESRSLTMQLQQLQGSLREKQHIGNEELQTVIQKYNEAVFQKNELELKLFDLKEEKLTLNNQLEQLNSRLGALTDQISVRDRDQLVVRMENQDLRGELEGFRRECSSLQKRLQEIEREKDSMLRDRTVSERELIDKLRQAQDAKLTFAADLESKHLGSLTNIAGERDRIRRELDETREQLVRTNVEREHLIGNVTRLQQTLDDIHANRDEIARSKSQLQISLRQSTCQLTQLQTEQRIRFETTISHSQQQINDLARQNGDLHSQLDRLTHRNAELQRENEDFRKEHGDRSVAIDRIRFENGQLAMNLEEAKRELRSKQCEIQSLTKSLTYQIDSIDRARRLVQEEYDRERAERIELEARLRQSEINLMEASTRVFGAEKHSIEAARLQEALRNEADVRQKLEGMFEANRLELYSLKETLKLREVDWQRERSRLFEEIRGQQTDLDSMSSKLGRLQGESENKLVQYQEKLSHMTFELQSARNDVLNRSNEYDAEIHRLRLALQHGQAEHNSVRIVVDRLQQQLKQAEDQTISVRRESQVQSERYEKDNQHLRNELQYLTNHYETLIKEIRQASAEEEAVKVKAELVEKLSHQYEQRITSLRSELSQQEAQHLSSLRLEYEQRIGSYEREKVELLSKVDSYQKQISELSHQTNSSNNEQSIQIMQLQQRFKEVNDGLSHTEKFYQSRIDQLTQDISRRSKEYEQKLEQVRRQEEEKHIRLLDRLKQSESRGYNGELSRITEQYEMLAKRQYRQYEQSATQLKNSLEQKISEVSSQLQGKVNMYEQRIRELERLKLELEDRITRLQNEHQLRCSNYEHNIRQLQDQLKRRDDELYRQRHQDTRYEDSASLLMNDLQGKLTRIEVRARQLEGQLTSEKRAAELASASQRQIEQKTTAMIQSLQKQMSDSNSQLTEYKFKNMFLEGEIDRLRRELDSSRDKQLAETSVESRRKVQPELSKLEEKNRIIIEQREEIQNLLHRYDKLRVDMSSRQDKHFEQIRALKDVSFGLEKETIEVNSKLQLSQIKIEELKVENRQLREQVRTLEQQISLKKSVIGGVTSVSRQTIGPSSQQTQQPQQQISQQHVSPPHQQPQPQPIPQGFPRFDLYQGARSTESMALDASRRITMQSTNNVLQGSTVAIQPNMSLPLRSGLMSPQYTAPSPNAASPFFKHMVNPPSTTTTIQSSATNYPTEEYRAGRTVSKALTIENIIKIDNPEGRNDSRERIIQLGGKRSEYGTVRQSSKSPNERKITITYDTTKRTLNSSNNNLTSNKPNSGSNPIEVTTKIIQPSSSPRGIGSVLAEEHNKSGSRERPRMMQVVSSGLANITTSSSHNSNSNQPFLKFQSPPPRIESGKPSSPQMVINSYRQSDQPKTGIRVRLGSDSNPSEKANYERSSYFNENKISLATNENSHPNLITRVNSSHTLGAGIQLAGRQPTTTTVVSSEEYQFKPKQSKMVQIKRVQSSSINLHEASSKKKDGTLQSNDSETEEQGIRVFQINELQKKPCC